MSEDRRELEACLLKDPFNQTLRLRYARHLLDTEEYEAAVEQCRLVLQAGSESADIRLCYAEALASLDRLAESREQYELARQLPGFKEQRELEVIFGNDDDDVEEGEVEDLHDPSRPKLTVVDGGSAFAPGAAEVLRFERPQDLVRFSDIAGMSDLKKALRMKIIEPFVNPGLFAKFKKRAGGGVLLYGPPGCGKTMSAKAIAAECKASFLSVGISDVLNMYIGESERNLALLFERARAERPCVLFFDELDALAYSRSKASSEHRRTVVNEFLQQLDGVDSDNDQMLILGATNMPWDVDPAIKRPGRFSRSIFVPPPDEQARAEMFRKKLHGIPASEIDFHLLARSTQHCSGADIDGIIEEAKEAVLSEIFDSGVERELNQADLLAACQSASASTIDWLQTARNIVKYGGGDKSYADVGEYLKKHKLNR